MPAPALQAAGAAVAGRDGLPRALERLAHEGWETKG